MSALKRLARDPLLHFLIAGGLLFVVFRAVHGPGAGAAADASTIVIDPARLVKFMQYRSMAFQPKYFNAQFAAMPADRKHALVDDYVREEALFREATSMGLADGDYVIRRRMVQKMLYLLDDAATESFAPSQEVLRKYYLAHQERYRITPTFTFTQVFIDSEIKRPGGAESAAKRLKRELEARKAAFDDAPQYGDRFPYQQNYVKRSADFIGNQFGPDFAAAIETLEPSTHWQGPIKSQFGYHLVLLTQRTPARLPKLADIEDEVRSDLLRDTVAAYRDTAVKDLTRRFKVELKGFSLDSEGPVAPSHQAKTAAR